MENFLTSLSEIMSLNIIFLMIVGVIAGIIFGSIPGFTITMAVALTLPFSFAMEPLAGISLMMGVWAGGASGGLITSILLGIPGTPSSVATTFDGYPMTLKGEPGRALSIGLWSSFFGTIIAGVILVFAAPVLSQWALAFGPWEYFSLMVLGLSAIASMGQGDMVKGLTAGALGIFVGTVGQDPVLSVPRFTFGESQLLSGFDFLPVLIGIFAFSQLLSHVKKGKKTDEKVEVSKVSTSYSVKNTLKDLAKSWVSVIRSSLVGVLVGILPAAGGSIANLLSYDVAKKTSKNPESFGKGNYEGVIAAEAANNSSEGGALIPTMAFGIPGGAITAMMLGVLLVHGIQPGPYFISSQPTLAYGIFIAFFTAGIFALIIQGFGIKLFVRINDVPMHYLIPIVLVLCAVGTFAINNRVFDVWALLLFGLVGYFLNNKNYSLPAFVLGVILGPMTEENLRRAIASSPDLTLFFTRPISGVLLGLTLISILYAIYQEVKTYKRMKKT